MRFRCVSTAVLCLLSVVPLLAAAPQPAAAEPRYISHGGAVRGEYIVVLADTTAAGDVASVSKALGQQYGAKVLHTFTAALRGLHVHASAQAAKGLANDPRVRFVEENVTMELTADSRATAAVDTAPGVYEPGWSLHRITHRERIDPSASGVYSYDSGGEGVIAYVFDTGVLEAHDEFSTGSGDRVEKGFDAYHPAGPNDFAWSPCPDSAPEERDSCPAAPCLAGGHGTMAASLLGGRTFGVAPGVLIVPVRVAECRRGEFTLTEVLRGLEFTAGDLDVRRRQASFRGAVINMSIHTRREEEVDITSLRTAVARVVYLGAVVVTGAGNQDDDACGGYPSALSYGNGRPGPHVIVASGVDHTDTRRCDSLTGDADVCTGPRFGRGRCVDIFAPATDMRGAALRGGTTPTNAMRRDARYGTSWAAPQVAGAAARLLTEYNLYDPGAPGDTSDKVWRMLRDTATPHTVQDPGQDSPNRLLYIGSLKITEQPQSSTVAETQLPTVRLKVTVADLAPGDNVKYQWFQGDFVNPMPLGADSPELTPPAAGTYWVRVTKTVDSKVYSVDSLPATVLTCGAPRGEIRAIPVAGIRTQLYSTQSGVRYEWYVGQPGDTTRLVHSNTDTPHYLFTPVATETYWVRVFSSANCWADSANSVLVTACLRPMINSQPVGGIVGGIRSMPASHVLAVGLLDGSDYVYQWYEVIGGEPQPIAGATRDRYQVINTGGTRTFFVRITSLCAPGAPVDSNRVDISFTSCDIDYTEIRLPQDAHPRVRRQLYTIPWNVNVPAGRSVAITAQATRKINPDDGLSPTVPTTGTIRWLADDPTRPLLHAGPSYYVTGVTQSRRIVGEARQADIGGCVKAGLITVTPLGEPLILPDGFPLNDGSGRPQVRVRANATHVVIEWRKGPHDDTQEPFLTCTNCNESQVPEDRKLQPGETYWVRVVADYPDGGETPSRVAEDTPVYTAAASCGSVSINNPNTRSSTPLQANPPTTINVPAGAGIALTATSSAPHLWQDGFAISTGRSWYAPDINAARTVTVQSPVGCLAGRIRLNPVAGCQSLIPAITVPSIPLNSTTATLAVTLRGSDPDVDILWYESEYDDSPTITPQQFSVTATQRVVQLPIRANRSYWLRVLSWCGTTRVTEDTPMIRVSCSDCKNRAVRRFGVPHVRVLSSLGVRTFAATYYAIQDGDVVKLRPPAEAAGNTYEWRHDGEDENAPAFSTSTEIDGAPGSYWVRTTAADESITDSYVTRLALASASTGFPLIVDPESRFIPAQGIARFTPDLPDTACRDSVNYIWWERSGYDNLVRRATDADSDPSRLDVINLPDNATFWLEATWYGKHPQEDRCYRPGDQGAVQYSGSSEEVEITVTCDPAASVYLSTTPWDTHLAKDEMIAISAWGLGKLVTYMWYLDSGLEHPFAIGPAQYKSFREDTTLWIQGIDACGNTDTKDVKFFVCKPSIVSEPADVVINNTQTRQLIVDADPAQAGQQLEYQWYRSSSTEPWTAVANATTDTINVTGLNTASYYCRISATCSDGVEAAVTTRVARVEVCAKPVVVWTTYDQNVRRTELQTLHVEATGKDLTYQWYRGASGVTTDPIAGATGDSYALYVQDTTTFWVRVFSQGECSADSAAFTLTVSSAPEVSAITATPSTVFSGGTTTLSVTATATSSAPLTYSWLKVTDLGYTGVCANQTTTCVTEALTAPATYLVRVTSGTMMSTESAPITVAVCTFPQTIPAAPDVQMSAGTMQLITLPIDPPTGNSITWYRGASGDTSNVIAPAGPSHQLGVNPTVTTQYWARVERDGCISTSGTTTVRVCVPKIVTQPAPGSIVSGESHSMTFVTNGTDAAQTFQWYRGNPLDLTNPVAGATSATLTVSPTETTTYWCRATSNCGRTVDSNATVVNVCTRPAINGVTNASIAPGQTANVHVNATGSGLAYQWYRGTTGNTANLIAGATQLTLTQSPAATTQYWCRVTSNGSCWSDSPTATISVCTPATITTEPADKTIASGQTAQLSVVATGATGYQWYRGDGSVISGATASSYTTPALTADATYFVRVLNGVCTTQSRTVTVTACTLGVSISGAQIGRGQSATLTAGVSGARSQELYYTWYLGASGNTATVWTAGPGMSSIMVSPNSTTSYWVRVNDGTCTADSNTAVVDVCRPAITTHPAAATINSGAGATLTVGADISPVTVQWYAGAKGVTSSPVAGATGTSATLSPASSTTYWARVTGTCGTADSNAALVCVRPTITGTQGASIAPGSAATINVTASGATLSYQWYVGTTGVPTSPIASWNYPHLNVNPTTTTNYWVRVTSSGACSTDSPTITVSVCTNPTITTQPANAVMYPGYNTATLSVTASPATGYQWYRGASGDMSAPVSGATSSTFNPGALTADTTYWVRVSNGLCGTNSAAATVMACRLAASVNSAQTAVSQSTTLTVSVSNARSQSLYYTWYVGASGNTSQVLTAGPTQSSVMVSPSTTTSYWVKVDDGTCITWSNTATVNVCIPRVSTQPVGGTIAAGQSRTLTVASDLPGATFQWYVGNTGGGTPIAGATGASYVASPSSTTNYWALVTGSCGVSVGSNTATVEVCAAPFVNANPSTYSIVAGQSANIGVNASGTNLTYQWYTGASGTTTSPINGATSAALTVTPSSTTQYWCRVTSSGACTTNGATITVDVCTSPSITTQPASATIVYAYNVTLSVAATSPSGGTLTYQWYRGASGDTSNPISGATGTSFNTGALYADAQYWVRVTRGACAVNSAAAYVTVCAMGAGVSDVLVASNQTATLTAALSGARTSTPYYAWYMGATGNTSTPVNAGTNLSSILVSRAATTQYWVRVTDGGCTTDSNTATYNVCIPAITSQPASVTISSGASTTLNVGTTGSGLSYQWYQGAAGVYTTPVGTNSPSLTVAPSSTTQYWVRIAGCGGTAVSSAAATVTVCVLPTANEPIADSPVNPGSLTGVRVNTSGTGPLSYQWYRGQSGNTQYPVGTSSATYTFNIYQSEYYWVRVTGPCGSVNSPAKMVSVNPTITQQPQSVQVSSGSRATFTVVADGTYLGYQWYTGSGVAISGATSATYTTPPLTSEQTYFVYVYSGNGMRQSAWVTASICEGPGVSFSAQYGYGNCYTLYVQPWNYGAYELAYDWYEGQPGDTSKPLGRGSYYRSVCPTVRTTYWVRAWTPDMTCYTDTGGISIP